MGKQDLNDLVQKGGQAALDGIVPDPARPRLVTPSDQPNWQNDLLRDQHGHLRREVGNVVQILAHHDDWQDVLTWNEFTGVIELKKAPPFKERPEGAEWRDEDTTRTRLWLARNMDFVVGRELVQDALPVAAQRRRYHPVRDYLRAQRWDGKPRVDGWLHAYAGAVAEPYVTWVGRWWLISAVARVLKPGAKVDTVPVLESAQGLGKSTLCRTLAVKPDWFSDTEIAIGTKDSRQALRGRWIIELGELASLSRADLDRIKQFLTQCDDKYRPPYGRAEIVQPRQCIFVGTVNVLAGDGYLRDPTGARRFLPVRLGSRIDLDAITRDRDQLWAEAVDLFDRKVRWWPDGAEHGVCQEMQAERQESDPWEDALREWVSAQEHAHEQGAHKNSPDGFKGCLVCELATVANVLHGALNLPIEKQDLRAQKRVVVAMRRLGWEKERRRMPGEDHRAYAFRPVLPVP